MLDGRHTGTGGGNHVTLGGATPADSPLLRRPDLLQQPRSPTGRTIRRCRTCSRARSSGRRARRRASTRRATTASTSSRSRSSRCAASTRPGEETPTPWLVDRLLRHLLTDLTGNTHRAEFSIDKLYSPDSADRPPRPARVPRVRDAAARADERRADAAAARAGRALLAASRIAGGLVRWGTALHDRWLLPHFVAADMRDVVADLDAFGYPFAPRLVRAVRRVPLPALRHGRPTTASRSSCGRRSSRGTCWARR